MNVRQFTKNDLDSFLRLSEQFYASGAVSRAFDYDIAMKTFTRVIDKHENLWGLLLVDKEDETLVGYSLVTSYWCHEEGGNVIILDELFICPTNRHKGYGAQFLEWLYDYFKDKAVAMTLEVLTTNEVAHKLYSKLGFVPDGFETLTKKIMLN